MIGAGNWGRGNWETGAGKLGPGNWGRRGKLRGKTGAGGGRVRLFFDTPLRASVSDQWLARRFHDDGVPLQVAETGCSSDRYAA